MKPSNATSNRHLSTRIRFPIVFLPRNGFILCSFITGMKKFKISNVVENIPLCYLVSFAGVFCNSFDFLIGSVPWQ